MTRPARSDQRTRGYLDPGKGFLFGSTFEHYTIGPEGDTVSLATSIFF